LARHPRESGYETITEEDDEHPYDGKEKIPHPEEAVERLSRRTHCSDPANLR
jgi:hypothetical protein